MTGESPDLGETAEDAPFDKPILRIEVTVAAAIQMPDDSILGRNMAEATMAFGWRADNVPDGLTDEQVNRALSKQLSPVMALIQTTFTFQGWVAMGQVDQPMTEHATDTGQVGHTEPVTVEVRYPTTTAIHD